MSDRRSVSVRIAGEEHTIRAFFVPSWIKKATALLEKRARVPALAVATLPAGAQRPTAPRKPKRKIRERS